MHGAETLIPRPVALTPRPGRFEIPAEVHLAAGPGAERAAALLGEYLGPVRPRATAGPAIRLELDPEGASRDPNSEAYTLEIDRDAVVLRAPAEAGLFHGVQTLRQLLPPDSWSWPCLSLRDAPRLPWRGVLLDVARHYMPPAFLHRFVDLLALHKLNVLHLHLTDDQGWRIEIEGLPRLTEVGGRRAESMIGPAGSDRFDGTPHGGFYTQGRLRSLVRHAASRGVRVVPEIEMPGHARAALAAYPRLGTDPGRRLPVWTSWGISEDVFGVHDEALDFCRHVLSQTMDIFPDRYIHLGGDECPTAQWEADPFSRRRARDLGLPSPAHLHGWFLREMSGFVAARGRRAVCWDETGQNPDDLPAEMALTAWRDPVHGAAAIRRGHQVIMAPHLSTYFDYPQRDHPDEPPGHPEGITTLEDVYRYDPLAGGLPVADPFNGLRPGVMGTQAQLWTEFAPTPAHVEYLAYPRLCALAEVAWSGGERDYAEFRGRLDRHAPLLRRLGIAVRLPPQEPRPPASSAPAETMDA